MPRELLKQGFDMGNVLCALNSLPAELIFCIRNFIHPGYQVCLFQKLCPETFEVCCRRDDTLKENIAYLGRSCDMCGVWENYWLCEGVELEWVQGTFCSLWCAKFAKWEQWEDPNRG